MTTFELIGNNGFTTEDYPEPEVWARVLRDAGLGRFEYFVDHLEPGLFRRVIEEESAFFQATLCAIEKFGLEVFSAATARISYIQNMLNHPYPDMRRSAAEWSRAFIDLAVKLGAKYVSGHYDCISLTDVAESFDLARARQVEGIVEMARYGAARGIECIFLEQMHRRQLLPYTIRGAQEILADINAESPIPVRIHVDTGHAAHVRADPDHTDRDKDPYAWLATRYTDNKLLLVHVQQTDDKASRHWPFTHHYNRIGIIDGRRVIRAIESSGVEHAVLVLEILYPRGTDIGSIARDIAQSADYWREAFAQAGYAFHDGIFAEEPSRGACDCPQTEEDGR